jgi:hypothetical protein
MATVAVAYNPNDFFYASSYNTPSDDICTNFLKDDTMDSQCASCNDIQITSSNIDEIISNTNAGIKTNAYIAQNGNVFIGNCDLNYFRDNSMNCFPYQLCKNKNLANKMQKNYDANDERYANIKKEYDYALLHTINIISGIFVITGFTFFYYISE